MSELLTNDLKSGETLRMIRQIKGISLKKLSVSTSIPASILSEIENNKELPKVDILHTICNHLGLTQNAEDFVVRNEQTIQENIKQQIKAQRIDDLNPEILGLIAITYINNIA